MNAFTRSLILLCLLSVALAPPARAQAPLFEGGAALSAARADLAARRYAQAAGRLEPLLIGGGLAEEGKALLADIYRDACNDAYTRHEYRQAINFARKRLALRPADTQMASILHKLYFRGGFYTEGIAYGKHLAEHAPAIGLAPADLAKIHGGQAMLYAAIGEPGKCVGALCESHRLAPDADALRVYLKYIVPDLMSESRFLEALKGEGNGPAEARGAIALLVAKPVAAASGDPVGAPPAAAADTAEAGLPVAMVLRGTRPVALAATGETEFVPKREIYLEFVEEGDRLMKAGRFADAERAYVRALEAAPPAESERLGWKRMQAYFARHRDRIEYTGYAGIAFLTLVFLWYMGLFRRGGGQYGTVAPAKLLARAQRFVDKENWDAAIVEYSKIPENSLSRDESLRVSLNLALAYMAKESHANAIIHARRALAKEPANVDATLILGKVYLKTGDRTSRAVETYDFLAERNLANVRMLKELCAAHLRGNVVSEKSFKVATDVLRFEPDDVAAGQIVAKWYHHNNRTDDEAAAHLQRLAEKLPRDLGLKLFLLELHFRRKDYKAVVREAMFIFPLSVDNAVVHSLFIDALVRMNQPKVLLQEYQRLLHENPGSAVVKHIFQSLTSLLVKKRAYPEVDVALSLKVNFTMCPKCFHLNLTEFNHCQKCKAQLTP